MFSSHDERAKSLSSFSHFPRREAAKEDQNPQEKSRGASSVPPWRRSVVNVGKIAELGEGGPRRSRGGSCGDGVEGDPRPGIQLGDRDRGAFHARSVAGSSQRAVSPRLLRGRRGEAPGV